MSEPKLYYGTDARFLTLSADIRQLYDNVCTLMINELYPKFSPYYAPTRNEFKNLFDEHRVVISQKEINDLVSAMWKIRMSSYGNQFGSFEVHNLRIFACSDAIVSFAGGNLGWAAYVLIKVAEKLNWILYSENSFEFSGVKLIKSLAEGDSKPVVISSSQLSLELKEKLDSADNCIINYKLSKEEFQELFGDDISKYNIESVSKDISEELQKIENRIPFLYHGTDARIINMSRDERDFYFECCRAVIEYFWGVLEPDFSNFESKQITVDGKVKTTKVRKIERYKPIFESQKKLELYNNLIEKMWMIDSWKNGNEQYQYGDLYLTSSKMKAMDYAVRSFAGGELGLIAQRLLLSAEVIGLEITNLDKKTKVAIDTVRSFVSEQHGTSPVIVKVPDIDVNYLYSDKGERIEWMTDHFAHQDFRYLKEITLSLENAEYIKINR